MNILFFSSRWISCPLAEGKNGRSVKRHQWHYSPLSRCLRCFDLKNLSACLLEILFYTSIYLKTNHIYAFDDWWLLGNYCNLKVVMNLETTKSSACQVSLENLFSSFSSSRCTLIANLSSPNCAKSLAHKRTQALWAALYGTFSRIILRTQVTDFLICLITSWLLSF